MTHYVIMHGGDGRYWRRGAGSASSYGNTSGWASEPTIYTKRTVKMALRSAAARHDPFTGVSKDVVLVMPVTITQAGRHIPYLDFLEGEEE